MTLTAARPGATLARRFHALADPTRLEILARLAGGERCVCDLVSALDAAQSRLSFHLKVLRQAGIVRARREGRWMYYSIDREALDEMAGALRSVSPGAAPGSAAPRCD